MDWIYTQEVLLELEIKIFILKNLMRARVEYNYGEFDIVKKINVIYCKYQKFFELCCQKIKYHSFRLLLI